MARKNFRATGGIDIDTSAIPTSIIQETITSNSATTVDTIALDAFLAAEYTVTLTQGSKIRTSKVIMQTDGTSVDMTEFAITETGGTLSGVAVSATTASTNAVLQITVTDAASTLVRYKLVRNITTLVGYAPDAPTGVSAVDDVANATTSSRAVVSFTAPVDNGGSAITSYTVTSSPENITSSGSSSPVTITGLAGNQNYTFTVTATNAFGTSSSSSASSSVFINIPPKASGGTQTITGGYTYHTFTSSSNFIVSQNISIDAIVVAGGGGGGARDGMGGGAGGLLTFESQNINPGTYAVTVGAGATSVTNNRGNNGSNSSIQTLTTAIGGGGGASFYGGATSGGSGGGGGGAGTAGQGNNGGSGTGSGGGGAGAAGANGGGGQGYAGGIGGTSALITSIGNATSRGVLSSSNRYFAGGGGGLSGSGGLGGGGNGGNTGGSAGGSGTANTGGGGGSTLFFNVAGGAGGSGIVIIRYTT